MDDDDGRAGSGKQSEMRDEVGEDTRQKTESRHATIIKC